jgi:DNA invertase Pin-like site-specific DNA recombinase
VRAGIYLRISQDRTGEEAGVNRQREDCLALVDQLGWQTVEVYQDNDISATSGKPRPAYRQMLTDIGEGRINAVVAWHTDRLYRRLRDLEDLADLCNEHKIMVRTVRAGEFDLSTATGRMLAGILGSVAKGEVEIKSERWKRSFRQRRDAGHWFASGPRTFGYDRDGKIVEDEAALIRAAAAAINNGDGFMDVCTRLRDQDVTTTRGNPWTPTALRLLLTNPRIAGLVTIRGDIIGKGTWEPILDRATWEQLRALIDDRQTGRGGNRPRSLLNGIAFCGVCDKPLVRSTTSVPVYQCRIAGTWSARHVTVSAAPLEQMVEVAAKTALSDERVRDAITARLRPGLPDVLLREIEDHERELAELRGTIKNARHAETKADIIAEMDRVRDEIADRRARLIPMPDIPVTGEEWPTDTVRRSKLIRLVVGGVSVAPATRRGVFDHERVRIVPVLADPVETQRELEAG